MKKQGRIFVERSYCNEDVDDKCFVFGDAGITFPLIMMSGGYKNAADKLCRQYLEGQNDIIDNNLVFPIWFLYRHSIELRLKLLAFYYSMPAAKERTAQYAIERQMALKNNHDILKLWDYDLNLLKDRIINFGVSQELIREIEKGIFYVSQIDPYSFSMRYPMEIKLDRESDEIQIHDLHKSRHIISVKSLLMGYGQLWDNLNEFSTQMDNLFSSYKEEKVDGRI